MPTTVPTEGGETGETENGETPAELTPEELIAELQAKLDEAQAKLDERKDWDTMIAEQSAIIGRQGVTVIQAESAMKQAKGLRDSAKEKYDSLVSEFMGMLRDSAIGQKRLDFEGGGDGQTLLAESETDGVTVKIYAGDGFMTADPAKTAPITELGTKFIKNLLGGEEFARWKDREEPVGLTDKQIDDLAGTELHTIADLESKMKASQFWEKDSGLGAKTADRVVNTLFAWRQHHPHVEPAAEVAAESPEDSETDDESDSDSDSGEE